MKYLLIVAAYLVLFGCAALAGYIVRLTIARLKRP